MIQFPFIGLPELPLALMENTVSTREDLGVLQSRPTPPLDELVRLRALVLEMGRAIRRIDVDHEYLEFWTQEGEYVLDGRFRHE